MNANKRLKSVPDADGNYPVGYINKNGEIEWNNE